MVPPAQLIDQIIQGVKYEEYTKKVDGKEKWQERMDNLWQLINMASKYTDVGLEQLTLFMEEVSLMTSIEEWDEDPNAVRLMSVHGSKWLEFPYVFIVGLEENILPLWKAKFDEAELEEERRGMYVAITRAKDHLFLSHTQSRQQRWQIKYNQPSRFLEEIPEELIKRYDMSGSGSTRYITEKSFDDWDRIHHKLFGAWTIVEAWWDVAIIKFDNPKFKVRKMEMRYLKAL
jgi:DNA helicase-2/ATP-dependent DNA helicase PcrA